MKNVVEKIKKELSHFSGKKLLVAVSGGVDSMVLLHVVHKLKDELALDLCAITINHNIREKKETELDISTVKDFCNKLNVKLLVYELPEGAVKQEEEKRNRGIEEAARYLRYKTFDKACDNINFDFILTAHNYNDNLETILQRVLQGGDTEGWLGIWKRRGKYLRPMLNISKEMILDYAENINIPYNNDSTNFDTTYFRNNIRLKLIPFLDENFKGWQQGLLTTSEKVFADGETLELLVEDFSWEILKENNENIGLYCDLGNFIKYPINLRIRILKKALKSLGYFDRISRDFLYNFAKDLKFCKTNNFEFSQKNNKVFIKNRHILKTKKSFFAIIDNGNNEFSTLVNYEKNEKE